MADGQPRPARLVIARRQRFMGNEKVVQAARPGQSQFQRGIEQRSALVQQAARMVQRDRLQEGFR